MNSRTIFLFRKYLKNDCSPEELDELLEALRNDKKYEQLDIITNTLWQAIHLKHPKNLSDAERISRKREAHHLISHAESRKSRYLFASKRIRSHMTLMAAAVVIAAVFVIGGIQLTRMSQTDSNPLALNKSDFQHFITDNKTTRLISLSDGTKVHLNKGTDLRIITNRFNRKQREVWLEGEAFFDVAKNPVKPFIIHTGEMTTTVRGTSFNVKAYPQLSENVVSVRTGKVEVTAHKKVLAMLLPGKQLTYHSNNESSDIQVVDRGVVAAWIDGRLVLNNASVTELKLRLKQQFGAELQIESEALNTVKLNAVFYKDARLEDVMETISELYGLHYQITNSSTAILFK